MGTSGTTRTDVSLVEPMKTLPKAAPARPGDAAGVARVFETDPLLDLLARQAIASLGFAVPADSPQEDEPPTEICFVGLDSLTYCARCGAEGFMPARAHCGPDRRREEAASGRANASRVASADANSESAPSTQPSPGRALLVGYIAGPAVLAAAHAAHGCVDVVLLLRPEDGRASFHYPIPRRPVRRDREEPALRNLQLTPREADVLLLLLAGHTTREIAGRLWLSAATVRSHCRSLLVKSGATNRRALRTLLLGASQQRPAR